MGKLTHQELQHFTDLADPVTGGIETVSLGEALTEKAKRHGYLHTPSYAKPPGSLAWLTWYGFTVLEAALHNEQVTGVIPEAVAQAAASSSLIPFLLDRKVRLGNAADEATAHE